MTRIRRSSLAELHSSCTRRGFVFAGGAGPLTCGNTLKQELVLDDHNRAATDLQPVFGEDGE